MGYRVSVTHRVRLCMHVDFVVQAALGLLLALGQSGTIPLGYRVHGSGSRL